MAATILHKRGDTFDRLLLMPSEEFPDGYFLGWDVTSQIRTPRGTLVADLTTSWADPAADTRVLRIFSDPTEDWPIGRLEIDVQFTRQSDSLTRSTETLYVDILKDVTRP